MMDVVAIKLAKAGVRLTAVGDKLMAGPRESVTPEIAELIRANRDSLLAACVDTHGRTDRCTCAWDSLSSGNGKYHARFEEIGDKVVCSLAIRDVGTCELIVPADQFDYGRVIAAMDEPE